MEGSHAPEFFTLTQPVRFTFFLISLTLSTWILNIILFSCIYKSITVILCTVQQLTQPCHSGKRSTKQKKTTFNEVSGLRKGYSQGQVRLAVRATRSDVVLYLSSSFRYCCLRFWSIAQITAHYPQVLSVLLCLQWLTPLRWFALVSALGQGMAAICVSWHIRFTVMKFIVLKNAVFKQ